MKLFLLGVLLTSSLSASEPAPSEAKIVMDRVHDSFVKIIPYAYSEKLLSELKDKKNEDKKEDVIHTLNDISNFFKSARHVETFQKPGFKPSLDTINTHMNETILSVKNNNTAYASKRLKAMTAICLSCHSQLQDAHSFAKDIPKAQKELFPRSFDYANYLMILRKFPDAQNYYELALKENLKAAPSDQINEEVSTSLKRVLSIHTKINFEPKLALSFVRKYKNEPNLFKVARDTLAVWEKDLIKWQSFKPKKLKSVKEFISTYLNPIAENKADTAMGENDITLLVASGILTKDLNKRPTSKDVPEILYWLAIAEKRLGSSYLFSLGDLYLKECIHQYPASPYAKKCYQEYEENVTFGYSGSGGTDIPEDEKQELAKLKGLLK
jgi:hypothetical protein